MEYGALLELNIYQAPNERDTRRWHAFSALILIINSSFVVGSTKPMY